MSQPKRLMCGIMGALAVLFAQTAMAAQPQNADDVPFFPLRAEPAATITRAGLAEGSVFYEQTLHPLAGIRTRAPLNVRYEQSGILGRFYEITIPSGTLFLSTIFHKQMYFCSAQTMEHSVLHGVVEAAVCLHDAKKMGVADTQFVLDNNGHRTRNVFELAGRQKNAQEASVDIPYERVLSAELPSLDLKMAMNPKTGFLGGAHPAVTLRLCAELVRAAEGETAACLYVDWEKADGIDEIAPPVVRRSFAFNADAASVKWGPVAVRLQRQSEDTVSVTSLSAVRPGLVGLIASDMVAAPGSEDNTVIVRLLDLPSIPALGEIEEAR